MISHYLPLALIYLAYPAVKTMACWRAALPFGWERGFYAHGPLIDEVTCAILPVWMALFTGLFCMEYSVRSRWKIVEDLEFLLNCFFLFCGGITMSSPVFQRSNAQSRPFVGRAECWAAITDSKR